MEQQPQTLWHKSVSVVIQERKLIVRAVLTLGYYAIIFYMLRLLFFYKVQSDYKDILLIIVGAIIGNFAQITNFWFKKDEEDIHEKDNGS